MHQGLATMRTAGGEVARPSFLTLLTDAYGSVAQTDKRLPLLAEARTIMDQNGPRYADAECHRLEGELRLHQSETDAAQVGSFFQQALTLPTSSKSGLWNYAPP
jgi:predicted ATPase